jgi:hypothetical protein
MILCAGPSQTYGVLTQAPAAISERSQSAVTADESDILTPEELAEIDRDFDRMEANIAHELQKRAHKAA